MKPIRTRPKFRCDFCRYTATAPSVENHEKICWLNPNRFCPLCKNTGQTIVVDHLTEPCYYCSKFTTKEQWEQQQFGVLPKEVVQ